jgi:hypothetical protein
MSKIRAFLIHFSISASVVGAAFAVIFFAWYPAPYFEVVGAWNVVRILIVVDLILGPLLTLILFRSGKPGLIFDLSIIAVVQISALVFGLLTIYAERPYFVVFAIDRFEVLARKDVDIADVPAEWLAGKRWNEPLYAVASVPKTLEAQQQLLEDVLSGKPDIERRPEFWSPYAENTAVVEAKATPLTEYAAKRADAADLVNRMLESREDADHLVGLPVIGKQGAFIIVLEPERNMPVGLIPVDPWGPAPQS